MTTTQLPRQIMPEQFELIASELKKHSPYPVNFIILRNDEEVSSYRGDLHAAILKGGWTVVGTEYADQVDEGMNIHFQKTEATAKLDRDPRHVQPDQVLIAALRGVGLQFNNGGSSGGGITQDKLTIRIGRRRRDLHGEWQKWVLHV